MATVVLPLNSPLIGPAPATVRGPEAPLPSYSASIEAPTSVRAGGIKWGGFARNISRANMASPPVSSTSVSTFASQGEPPGTVHVAASGVPVSNGSSALAPSASPSGATAVPAAATDAPNRQESGAIVISAVAGRASVNAAAVTASPLPQRSSTAAGATAPPAAATAPPSGAQGPATSGPAQPVNDQLAVSLTEYSDLASSVRDGGTSVLSGSQQQQQQPLTRPALQPFPLREVPSRKKPEVEETFTPLPPIRRRPTAPRRNAQEQQAYAAAPPGAADSSTGDDSGTIIDSRGRVLIAPRLMTAQMRQAAAAAAAAGWRSRRGSQASTAVPGTLGGGASPQDGRSSPVAGPWLPAGRASSNGRSPPKPLAGYSAKERRLRAALLHGVRPAVPLRMEVAEVEALLRKQADAAREEWVQQQRAYERQWRRHQRQRHAQWLQWRREGGGDGYPEWGSGGDTGDAEWGPYGGGGGGGRDWQGDGGDWQGGGRDWQGGGKGAGRYSSAEEQVDWGRGSQPDRSPEHYDSGQRYDDSEWRQRPQHREHRRSERWDHRERDRAHDEYAPPKVDWATRAQASDRDRDRGYDDTASHAQAEDWQAASQSHDRDDDDGHGRAERRRRERELRDAPPLAAAETVDWRRQEPPTGSDRRRHGSRTSHASASAAEPAASWDEVDGAGAAYGYDDAALLDGGRDRRTRRERSRDAAPRHRERAYTPPGADRVLPDVARHPRRAERDLATEDYTRERSSGASEVPAPPPPYLDERHTEGQYATWPAPEVQDTGYEQGYALPPQERRHPPELWQRNSGPADWQRGPDSRTVQATPMRVPSPPAAPPPQHVPVPRSVRWEADQPAAQPLYQGQDELPSAQSWRGGGDTHTQDYGMQAAFGYDYPAAIAAGHHATPPVQHRPVHVAPMAVYPAVHRSPPSSAVAASGQGQPGDAWRGSLSAPGQGQPEDAWRGSGGEGGGPVGWHSEWAAEPEPPAVEYYAAGHGAYHGSAEEQEAPGPAGYFPASQGTGYAEDHWGQQQGEVAQPASGAADARAYGAYTDVTGEEAPGYYDAPPTAYGPHSDDYQHTYGALHRSEAAAAYPGYANAYAVQASADPYTDGLRRVGSGDDLWVPPPSQSDSDTWRHEGRTIPSERRGQYHHDARGGPPLRQRPATTSETGDDEGV